MSKLKLAHPEFRHAPSAICGTGSIGALAGFDDGRTVFLTSDQVAVIDLIGAALERQGGSLRTANHFRKPAGEPTSAAIRAAAEFLKTARFDRLVAIGGGSVLDWARLACAHAAGFLDLDAGAIQEPTPDVRPTRLWLVPTTCATGAEAADVAVYTDDASAKRAVVSRHFLADKVILDGRFVEGMAPRQIATYLCDALSHSIEANVSLVPMPLAKEAGLSAFRMILERYGEAGSSSQRDRFMEASFLGGVAAANCSVGIVHAFAHAVGVDGVAHGLANACALRAGVEFNAQTPQMASFLARARLGVPDDLVAAVSPIVDCALADIGSHPIATRLRSADYRQRVVARMAADVALRTNPRRAGPDDLAAFVLSVTERVAR